MVTKWNAALTNINAYIEESEVKMEIIKVIPLSEDLFRFYLKAVDGDYEILVDMPCISLQELKRKDLDVLETPKVFVDGCAYRWDIALVKKAIVKDYYFTQLAHLDELAKKYRHYITDLSK